MTTADEKMTLCWNCSRPYPMSDEQCTHCAATNANHSFEVANAEIRIHELEQQNEQLQAQVSMLRSQTKQLVECLHDVATGQDGWAYEEVISEAQYVMTDTAQTAEAYKRRTQAGAWQPIETAPKDGTLLLLWVQFESHPTEDAFAAVTIGANNFKYDGHDEWLFAGWNWEHDCFTQGVGTPLLWMPLPPSPELKGE